MADDFFIELNHPMEKLDAGMNEEAPNLFENKEIDSTPLRPIIDMQTPHWDSIVPGRDANAMISSANNVISNNTNSGSLNVNTHNPNTGSAGNTPNTDGKPGRKSDLAVPPNPPQIPLMFDPRLGEDLLKKGPTFFKNGVCHLCKRKKWVYGCFKDFTPTSCNKMFCTNCLDDVYKERILDIIQKTNSWKCPYKRRVCVCKNCTGNDTNIKSSGPSNTTGKMEAEIPATGGTASNKKVATGSYVGMAKTLNQNKIKNLIEFTGQLIVRMNKVMDNLNQSEAYFYNKIISDNLKYIADLTDFSLAHNLYIRPTGKSREQSVNSQNSIRVQSFSPVPSQTSLWDLIDTMQMFTKSPH